MGSVWLVWFGMCLVGFVWVRFDRARFEFGLHWGWFGFGLVLRGSSRVGGVWVGLCLVGVCFGLGWGWFGFLLESVGFGLGLVWGWIGCGEGCGGGG